MKLRYHADVDVLRILLPAGVGNISDNGEKAKMNTTIASIVEQAEQLSLDDQLLLIAHLANRVRRETQTVGPLYRYRWRDIRGLFPPMVLGEDAQIVISRMRRESDEQRKQQWHPPL